MVALKRLASEPWAVAATLGAGLAVRIPSMDLPLIEWHGWRQTWTAYTALIYHERGIDLLHPQLPIFGPPYEVPQEFPFFQAMAALVMDAGIPPDLAVRLTCLTTFAAAAIALWRLVRHVGGPVAALSALVAFVFLPENLLWSRSGMIEYLPIAGAAIFVWQGLVWREEQRAAPYAIALAAGIVAMLAKATTPIFWSLPLVLWRTSDEPPGALGWLRARLDPRLIALCIVPTAVALLWTRHADDIKGVQEAAAFMTSIATRRFYYEGLAERVDPVVWKKILGWFTQLATGVALLPVIGLGLLAGLRSRRPLFWIGLFGAAAIPVAIFFGGFEKHDYYWTALTPEVAAFAGLGAGWLFARARTTPQRGFLALLLLAAVGVSDAYARDYWSRMYPPLSDFEQVLPRARELASLSAPDDKIVVIGRDYDPDLAYYARRRMLMLTAENETGHLVARLPAEGYRILFSWNPTQNEIGILRAWRWIGAIGPRTYATADTPRDLRGAEVIAADDVTVIDSIVRAGTPLDAPLRIPCDLATHTVPAGASGTWLRIAQPDPNARVTVDTLLAPLPARSVIAFRPAASLGARQVRVSCSGGGELVIEAAYDAPLPD